MPPAATRPHVPSTLYLAFELGNTEWKLAMTARVDHGTNGSSRVIHPARKSVFFLET